MQIKLTVTEQLKLHAQLDYIATWCSDTEFRQTAVRALRLLNSAIERSEKEER